MQTILVSALIPIDKKHQHDAIYRELLILPPPLATITIDYLPLEFIYHHDEDKIGIVHCIMTS